MTKIPEGFSLVGGDDEYMVDRTALEWFNQLKTEFGESAEAEIIDGRVPNVSEMEACLSQFMQAGQNLSLFGDKKIVWLRHITFLADNQTGRSEAAKTALSELTAWLEKNQNENTYLLLSAAPVDRRKATAKFFDKQKRFHFLSPSKNIDQVVQQAKAECERYNVRIQEDAAIALVDRVSGNMRMLMNEIEKLATYLADSDNPIINYELVNQNVPQFGEAEFFELADAFYSFDLKRALNSVRNHFFTHKDARPVLSNLQNRNRLLIQLRSLKDGQWIDLGGRQVNAGSMGKAQQMYGSFFHKSEHKSEFHPFGQNPWYLGRLAGIANRIPLRTLIDFQLKFIETFSRLIDHPNEQEQLVRNLVLECYQELKK